MIILFWIIWLTTIVVCFFFARATFKLNGNEVTLDGDVIVFYVFFWLIPFFNIIILGAILATELLEKHNITMNKFAKKIFFIKDDKND